MLEGKAVALTFPDRLPPLNDSPILGWRGWEYLKGAAGKLPERYVASYDWTPVRAATEGMKDAAAQWRIRVVIFTRTEEQVTVGGVARPIRHSIEDAYLKQVGESLARFGAWASAETNGHLRVTFDVTVEREVMRDAIGATLVRNYLTPRINGGGYEPDDKVFRGPYQSAIGILPGPSKGDEAMSPINGAAASAVYFQSALGKYAVGDIDVRLHAAWRKAIADRLAARGLALKENDAEPGTPETWAEAAATTEVATDTLLERLKTRPVVGLGVDRLKPVPAPSYASAVTDVTLVTDAEHGEVLHVTEKGIERNGGFAFPQRADGQPIADLSVTPTLCLSIRTRAQDPIGITLWGPTGQTAHVDFGRTGLIEVEKLIGGPEVEAPLERDSSWHEVKVDVAAIAKAAGFTQVMGMALEPSYRATASGRRFSEPIEVDVDNVRFTADAPGPLLTAPQANATSADPEDRALFAAQAEASSPELIALLDDKVAFVRLNAARAYWKIKDDMAQPNLIKDVVDLDPAVAAAGIRGLMHQGGEIALTTVRRSVRIGVTPLVRGEAGKLLGETKDPKYAGDIVALLTDKSWLNRRTGVEALGMIPGKETAVLKMAFLEQTDPEIKIAVARASDPTDEYQMRKLLWSAVNEPSDAVRAASDAALIGSPDATFRAEGYKGVRDDGRATRLMVLTYLEEHPNEAHRGALRLAVTDRSASVRAAALRAFAQLEKGVEAEEIANVLEDRDPEVQLALQALAKKRGFALNEKTRQLMSESPDERVRKGLEGLS